MKRLVQAIRLFFRVLGDEQFAQQAAEWTQPAAPARLPAASIRPDGLAVLAALQREARLVDFLQEPLDSYSDAQVGAAVREVHRQAGEAVERMFGLQPLLDREEGETVDVEPGYDPARLRLSGNVAGAPPYHGRLCHHGWLASRCDLPEWTGSPQAAFVVAPAEVQID